MKEMLCDAWKNYKTYIEQWEKGAEGDIYSLMYNLRKKWESTSKTKKTNAAIDEDMPPIIIVATHTVDELASPILLDSPVYWGKGFHTHKVTLPPLSLLVSSHIITVLPFSTAW